MSSVKELLRNAVDLLSEEEAQQIFELVQALQKRSGISWTLRRLASDPTFKLPPEDFGAFHAVAPIQGKGIAASKLLVEERR